MCIRMNVFMYTCMYVCMYSCMYVCMYVTSQELIHFTSLTRTFPTSRHTRFTKGFN